MVVDSSDLDVSDAHGGSGDDALNAESGDDGFVWATDDPETTDQETTRQSDDAATPAEAHTHVTLNDQFKWNGSVNEKKSDQPVHDRHDTTNNSDTTDPMMGENTTNGTAHAHSTVDTGGRDDSSSDINHDGDETVSLGSSTGVSDDTEPESVAIDPIDYPVDELRTIADCEDADIVSPGSESEIHGFVWSEPPEQHRTHVEDPTSEQIQRLLTIAGIDPERVGEKPYLTTLSTEDAGTFITGWLEFLTIEAGTQGAFDALERYHEVGWMTEPVAEELKEQLQWIDHQDGNRFETFDRGDHLLSFAYAAKIASLSAEGMMFY